MCEKVDLGQKACCTSAKMLLFVVAGGELLIGIVIAILAGIAGERGGSGWYCAADYITMGILTIVLCFYSAKWFVILNYIGQICLAICAVTITVVLGFAIASANFLLETGLTHKKKEKEELETAITMCYCMMAFSILGAVFSIMAGVVYAKVLCCGGGGGGSSSFSSGTS
ncbi:unnamed protein product [Caenorhabditis angaria]|uniref:Uncharacterized protein n=1 Tax=Caenorhabditis angaria TaxID=860376 RepID=A0A9P1ILL4_9PELO|nr:unnamed protein product [Caenorhabditis angaria]